MNRHVQVKRPNVGRVRRRLWQACSLILRNHLLLIRVAAASRPSDVAVSLMVPC